MPHLNYPLNVNNILRKKKSIKNKLLINENLKEKNIAILGGSTTSEVINILELFLLKNKIKPNFYESEYNKFYEDSLFGNYELDQFNPDIIYIHTNNKNILKYPDLSDSFENVEEILSEQLKIYNEIWSSLSKFNCPIIQNNFDYTEYRSLGNLDCYDIHGQTYFINRLNNKFSENARNIKNLYINDINYLSSYIGLRHWFDESLWYRAKYFLSMAAIPELTFNLSKIITSILGNSKKCLVLDLDNTCWGGVIGDEGIDGIIIGSESALAESYTKFQKYVKELKLRGVTLAVCSKNDFVNAKEGFIHPDSILKFDDFTAFEANWNPKHKNIENIANNINIGLDSIVFIDDNPVERDIVSSQVPSVTVPDVGNEVIDFIKHIDRNGYFETISLSKDDLNRNKYYKDNKKRTAQIATYDTYENFLLSLNMTAEIKSFSSIYLDRISQLTNKTNQFNLTTKRYNVSEISNIHSNDKYIKIYGKLTDKYGDNGLISVCIGRVEKEACHIDLWLMSCRVLKRDMELAMLDELVNKCKEKNLTEIIGYYYKSVKNNMVFDLYKKLDFCLLKKTEEDSIWKLDITSYNKKNKIIGVLSD